MAQRLNKKLVVGLTIAGMILMTVCCFVLIMLLPAPDPAPFVEQGKKFAAEGNYEQAMMAYANAAQRAHKGGRDSTEYNGYRLLAGDMAYKAGKVREAIALWERVTRDAGSVSVDSADEHDVKLSQVAQEAHERVLGVHMDMYRLIGNADWTTVAERARQLLTVNKENVVGLRALGLALIKQRSIKPENAAEGEKLLKQATELHKSDPEAASFLATHYLEEARRLLSGPRPYEAAAEAEARIRDGENVFEQLKAHLPEDPALASTAWRYRGMFYLDLRNLTWIRLEMLRRGSSAGGTESGLLEQLARADEAALTSLEKAVALAPQDDKNLSSLGSYWAFKPSTQRDEARRKAETESYQAKAQEAYKKAIHAAPDEFEAYLHLANLYKRAGQLDKAGDVLEQRLARGIQRGTHLEFRNRLYMLKIREETFDARLAQAAGLARGSQELNALIDLLDQQIKAYVTEAEGGENNAMAQFMKGRLLLLKGKTAEALEVLEAANVATGGTDPRIKLALAHLYNLNQAPGKAEKLLRDVTQTGLPNHEGAWAMLAAVQAELGEHNEALNSAQRALQLNPRNREALMVLGRVYEARGNTEEVDRIRKRLNDEADEATLRVQEAVSLIRTTEGRPDPASVEKAKALLRETLKSDPAHYSALRVLATLLNPKADDTPEVQDKKARELTAAIQAALAEVQRRKADSTAAAANVDYEALAENIRLLELYTHPLDNSPETLERMAKLIRQRKDPYDVAVALANLYNTVGQPEKAIEYLKEAHSLRPDEAGVLDDMFNTALTRKETWPLAEECIEKLVALNATRASGQFYRGRLALARAESAGQEQNRKEAQAQAAIARDQLRAGLKEFSTYPDAYAWLGQALTILGEYDEAQQALGRALELNPRHGMATLVMYELARIRRDETQRQQYLRRLQELLPNHPVVRQAMQLAEDERDPQSGIARRERQAKANPGDVDNLLALAGLYAQTEQLDKARQTFEQCLKLQPQSLTVIGRYATFLREKEPAGSTAAEQLLRQAVQNMENKNDKAKAQLMLAGHIESLAQKGGANAPSLADAAAAFEAAATINEAPEILMDIGLFYHRNGRLQETEARFRRAVELSNDADHREINRSARRALIQVLMTSAYERFGDVEREIAAYGEKFDDGFAQLAHCDLAMTTGRTAEAIADMNTYISKLPQEAVGFFRRGYLHYQRGDLPRAIEDLRQAVSLDPGGLNAEHRRLLARCLSENGEPDLAITQLNAILEENPNHTAAVDQLVELYVSQKQWTPAEALLLARARDVNSPNRAGWLTRLANLYARQGDAVRAVQAARDAAEISGFQLSLVSALADRCITLKRPGDFIQFVAQKLPAGVSQQPSVRLKLAEAYAAAKNRTQALELYNQLLQLAQNELGHARTLGASMRAALGDDAIQVLKKYVTAHPDDRSAKFALAAAEAVDDNYKAALDLMSGLLAGITGNDEKARSERFVLLSEMSRTAHLHRDMPTARKYYEQLLEIAPNDVMARNNLAYLLTTEFNDVPKALEHAELAVKNLAPNSQPLDRAVVVDTLGWILVLQGDLDAGLARLRQAISLLQSAPQSMNYTIAGIYHHAAEGFFRRSQTQASQNAQSDREEAILACRHAWRLLKNSDSDDPDNLQTLLRDLATKLQVPLEEPSAEPAALAR